MAKLVVQHDTDPAIGIVLEYVALGTVTGRALGWHGTCTECGHRIHAWTEDKAISRAIGHVNRHEAVVTGVDPSSVVHNPLATGLNV